PDRSPRRNRKDLAPAEGWPAIRGCAPSLCLACWDAQKCGALVTRAPRCQQGGCPTDVAMDVKNTELSPGGRRMLTLVGSECSSFARGREQDEAVGRTGNLYQGCRTDYGKHRCGYSFRYSHLARFDTLIWPHPTENHIPWTLLRA